MNRFDSMTAGSCGVGGTSAHNHQERTLMTTLKTRERTLFIYGRKRTRRGWFSVVAALALGLHHWGDISAMAGWFIAGLLILHDVRMGADVRRGKNDQCR